MSDRVRVMRILIYDGPREWVEKTVQRSIMGTKVIDPNDSVKKYISAYTLSEFPEIIKAHEEDTK
jgi:hypothetical protein